MNSAEIISSGLLELYAAGLASEKEAEQVLLWRVQYPEVDAELDAIELSLQNLAFSQAVAPSSATKVKLLAKISNNSQSVEENSQPDKAIIKPMPAYWRNIAAASILFLLSSIAVNYFQYKSNSSISSQLQEKNIRLANLEASKKAIEQDMQIVQSPYSQPISLKGLATAPNANAKIFWMQHTGEVFIDASNMPDLPQNKQYELWAFVDGKPVNAGIILTSSSGKTFRIQKMKTFGKVEAFAISMEDKNVQPATAPQGPVFVMGKM